MGIDPDASGHQWLREAMLAQVRLIYFGSRTTGGFHNVTFENIDIRYPTPVSIWFKSAPGARRGDPRLRYLQGIDTRRYRHRAASPDVETLFCRQ